MKNLSSITDNEDIITKEYVSNKENTSNKVPMIHKGLSATVYTQVSDVEGEINGIMTYGREIIKIDDQTIIKMNKMMMGASPSK